MTAFLRQDLVLGSVEDEIDEEAFLETIVDELPSDAHQLHQFQLTFLRLRDQLSTSVNGYDAVVAQKLMVPRSRPSLR